MTTAGQLLLAGVVLELVGLVVTVLEVRSRARAVTAFERRPVTHYGSAHGTLHMTGTATGSSGREPTLEERVDELTRRVEQLREELTESVRAAEARATETAGRIAEDVRVQVEKRVAEVADLVVGNVERRRRAYLGPGLFAVGLVLQAWSSAMQL